MNTSTRTFVEGTTCAVYVIRLSNLITTGQNHDPER
jgi:hypothetical protein